MPDKPVNIEFPVAGLDESAPHQHQPPYTTPDAANVRPYDQKDGRARGGSRPGLRLAYNYHTSGDYGSFSAPVRCIADVEYVDTNNLDEWADNFEGNALGESWGGLEILASSNDHPLPAMFKRGLCYTDSSVLHAAATSTPLVDYDASYSIALDIVPVNGEFAGTYRIYAGMLTTNPTEDDCVVCELTINAAGGYSGTLKRYASGSVAAGESVTFTPTTTGPICPGTLVLYHVGGGAGRYEVQWQDQYIAGATSPVARKADSTYVAVGFGMKYDGSLDDGRACVSQFRTRFYSTTNVKSLQRHTVAIANSKLYYSSARIGAMVEHATGVSSVPPISAASWGQFLYFANGGAIIGQGTGRVYAPGPPGAYLYAAGFDFSASPYDIDPSDGTQGYDPPVYALEIIQANKGIRLGTYLIRGYWNSGATPYVDRLIISGEINYTVDNAGVPCKWRIIERPIIYNPNASPTPALSYWYARTQTGSDPVTYSYNKGEVPSGCRILTRYYDRLWMAGSPEHLAFASRLGDPFDWDFSQTDVGRAYAIQMSDSGAIGEPIKALCPFGADYMIVGCTNSLWKIMGDPANDGYMTNVSRAVGIATQTSWCTTPEGFLIFVARDGMYALNPASSSTPEPMSGRIPARLRECIQNGSRLSLAWDMRDAGIWIFHTQDNVTKRTHWWYDWHNKGFWPVTLPDGFEPTSVSTDELGRVMLGGYDGTLRVFDEYSGTDCGEPIDSYVDIGPFRNGDERRRLRLSNLRATMSSDSGPVSWSVQAGPSGELCTDAAPCRNGAWESGLNKTTDPRVSDGAVLLRIGGGQGGTPLQDSANDALEDHNGNEIVGAGQDRPWAIETITATISDGGELRA